MSEKNRSMLRFWLSAVLLFALIASSCNTLFPQPEPTPTEKPIDTPTPSPSPTPLVRLEDDNAPLAPQVIARTPQGGSELTPEGAIEITFSTAMDQESTAAALRVSGPDDQVVKGQVRWKDTRTMQFQPEAVLQPGLEYQAQVGTNATSKDGKKMLDPFSFRFSVAGPLQVSRVFPSADARSVENQAVITVIFNRPVVPLVIVEQMDNLPQPLELEPAVDGQGEWMNTSVYIFRPTGYLESGVTYTARVPAGLQDASGEEGTSLAEDFTWEFTTVEPSIDVFQLPGKITEPGQGYSSVAPDEDFQITFRQPMDTGSTEASFSIISAQGEAVPVQFEWSEDDTNLVITPTQMLELDRQYTLTLDPSAQAASGGGLRTGIDWGFSTYSYPYIVSVQPSNGSVQNQFDSMLSIKFASPMDFDTLQPNVLISPEPDPEASWYYDEWDQRLMFFGLRPSTRYEVRLLPGMADLWGNQIGEETVVRFTTAPRQPYAGLAMPYYGAVMLREDGPQEFYLRYVNVNTVNLALYRVPPDLFVSLSEYRTDPYNYIPNSSDLVWQQRLSLESPLDRYMLKRIEPSASGGGPLPPGMYFLTLDAPHRQYGRYVDTRLLMVANSNLTFKTTHDEGLIWLTDLQSGEPQGGVQVAVYDEKFNQIGQGTTDGDGLLNLGLPEPEEPYFNRYAMTQGGEVFAFAASQWGSGVNPYDFGIWSDYYTPTGQPTSYVYTDRPIYRPGQPVYFKGVLRINDDLNYLLPDAGEVIVRIASYQETIYEKTLPLNEYGSFSDELTLDQEAVLGSYGISVFLPEQLVQPVGGVNFSVAEYRRPEFKVDVAAGQPDLLDGETAVVNVSAEYYSGGNVANAQVDWTLRASLFTFSPGGKFSNYSFEDLKDSYQYWYSFDPGASPAELIAEGSGVTGDDGRLVLELPVALNEEGRSQTFTLEATITDLSGSAVSDRDSFNVHRSNLYPGIRSQSYVGEVGKEQGFDVVLLDWEYQPVPGRSVDVEIFERRWYSVQEKDPTGRLVWKVSVEDIPVESFSGVQLDGNGEAVLTFTPPKGAQYMARVTATDDGGRQSVASTFMWVAGEEYIPWLQSDDRSFEIVADKDSYMPGETAEILIASPFQGARYALVTVERGHIRQSDVLLLESNSTVYRLPVTVDMSPNAYISVLVVAGVDEFNEIPDFRMGILEIKVDTSQRALNVEVTPDKEQAGPGDRVTYAVRTTDANGEPVSAEVSLSLADLAILSLSAPNSQPIVDFFYSSRTLGVRTSVPIVINLEAYNKDLEAEIAEGGGMGSGGGKGFDELGIYDIRREFPDTAYWTAHLVTDQNGQAEVTITLPDNLTTWRMDARAVTQDTLVGQAEDDLTSSKPLMLRPQTPRFFVAGDRARLAAAVHNNTGQDLSVETNLNVSGVTVEGDARQVIDVPAGRQGLVVWWVNVPLESERVDLLFTADGGGFSDATLPPVGTLEDQGIPVYRFDVPETVGTAGQLTESGSRVEGIALPPQLDVQQGDLTVRIEPSLAASMVDALSYLEHYPYECIEQTVSRFLPNVLTTQVLRSAGLSDPELEAKLDEQVSIGLQRLYGKQNADGGWGWWGVVRSDPYTSAYVVWALVEARDAGYSVSEDVLSRGIGFLELSIRTYDERTPSYRLNSQSFLLHVLARAGKPNVSATVQLYDLHQGMNQYALAYLASTLYWIDPEDPRVETLVSNLMDNAILSATGAHWEEGTSDWYNWNTDTRTTAVVLANLLLVNPENELNANIVRWLMSSRVEGRWRTTQETAWSLIAMARWMEITGELEGDYNFGVALNGAARLDGAITQENVKEVQTLRIEIGELMKDEVNRLLIARDAGPGSMYYTAHLKAYLPVEEVQALDRGIVVQRGYYRMDEPDTPVTQAEQGELLIARVTVIAPAALHYIVVDDPLPAGLEAVDQSLLTSTQEPIPQEYNYEDLWRRGWGWWAFEHVELRDERVVLSASYLPAGTYVHSYLVRAGFPGEYRVIPPSAQEFYFPEVYGRGEGSLFTVVSP